MSGIEIVGVIAGSLQLAELGMKLSVKLCSFYRQIKDADHSAQRLATDVSLTCSILHQLGKTLEQDRQTKLCSQQAFLTAKEVLGECEDIFRQIEDAVAKRDPGSGKDRWERGTRRLTIVILGPDLDVLKSHLDRLKSTMLLMLNVIMYAREISRTSDHSSLQTQRELIETLLREKTETEARFKRLVQVASVSSNGQGEGDRALSTSTLIEQPDMDAGQQSSVNNEIDKYYDLVKSLLSEIDTYQTRLQRDRHLRIRNGVVNVHQTELDLFSHFHGPAAVQAFDNPFFQIRNPAQGDYEMITNQTPTTWSHSVELPTPSSSIDPVSLPVRQSYSPNHRVSSMEDDSENDSESESESDRPYRHDSTQHRSSQQIKRVHSPRSRSRRYPIYHRPSYTSQNDDLLDSRYRRTSRPSVYRPHSTDGRRELVQRPGRTYGPPKKARRSNKNGRETSSGSRTYQDTSNTQPYDSDDDYNHPYNYNQRPSRRRSRRRDSELDTYSTDDEDLREYQREPSAPLQLRPRHSNSSSSSTASASDHSLAQHRNRNRLQWTPQDDPKPPRQRLYEEPTNPACRESVAPLRDAHKTGVPPGKRLTKIARRVVNPEALEAGNEQFEKRRGFVIVRRALSKFEIQTYAVMTQEIRDQRHKENLYTRYARRNDSSEDASSDSEEEEKVSDEQLKLKAPAISKPKKTSDSESSSHGESTGSSTSSGKEDLGEHAASKTLEDLVLSWTTLSRDMIQ